VSEKIRLPRNRQHGGCRNSSLTSEMREYGSPAASIANAEKLTNFIGLCPRSDHHRFWALGTRKSMHLPLGVRVAVTL